ncbi:MAG: helix-turn-helix domain-containing protein [Betaproteobacteria bacterium]|nr:helix-turn-helix domain-containing protein [Betaproteobacteria bacterium]
MKQSTTTPALVYRIPQAARLLAISRSSAYRLIDAGELELVKLGPRSSAITRASLIAFAEARSIPLPDSF